MHGMKSALWTVLALVCGAFALEEVAFFQVEMGRVVLERGRLVQRCDGVAALRFEVRIEKSECTYSQPRGSAVLRARVKASNAARLDQLHLERLEFPGWEPEAVHRLTLELAEALRGRTMLLDAPLPESVGAQEGAVVMHGWRPLVPPAASSSNRVHFVGPSSPTVWIHDEEATVALPVPRQQPHSIPRESGKWGRHSRKFPGRTRSAQQESSASE